MNQNKDEEIIYQGGRIMKKLFAIIVLGYLLLFTSGCALIGTALSAAAAYGIYKATDR